jgi:hypothetical protein
MIAATNARVGVDNVVGEAMHKVTAQHQQREK